MKETKVIAEIGCNHKGSMDIAKELISIAAMYAKADVVKFQKRCNKELLSEKEYNTAHPNPINSYGKTYGEHREFLEFNADQHFELKKYCESLGIDYSTSIWDITSAKEMIALNPDLLKVPSACNLNKPLLLELINNYKGEIHISLGMTTKEEEESIVSLFEKHNRAKDLIIYSCTSGYPVPFEDICLLEIKRLNERFKARVKGIAFSGHHLGIAADIAALTLGATHIERHYTIDRTWKGTDHAASLEPEGLRKLCRDVKNVSLALNYKEKEILSIEEATRNKLKINSIRW